jgi:putative membrane-bound dehydrogenase-like protein
LRNAYLNDAIHMKREHIFGSCMLAVLLGLGRATAQEPFPDSRNVSAAYRVQPGFRIELVASEPDVMAPVAMAFDETGRLFVAERPAETPESGRIRMLQDTEGTGTFKVRAIYLDGVPHLSALVPYDGGIFVAAGSQIAYVKDSQKDGRVDLNRVVFSGFSSAATDSPGTEPAVHSLVWGPDNRIHGGTFGQGGLVSSVSTALQLSLGNNDFSFDPRSLTILAEAGPSQSGLAFDLWGRKFVSDLRRPLRLAVYHPRYWERNPYFLPPPSVVDIIRPPHLVYRAFLGETNALWVTDARTARGRAGDLRQAWMPSAQGLVLYHGTAFPAEFYGNAFIADPDNHLIHRVVLRESGMVPLATRAQGEDSSEFLVGRSPQFRPANLAVGPEGALYIADYTDGSRGRIFRVSPSGFQRPKPTDWVKASALNLAAALASSNEWHRSTAMRLIYTRAEPAVVPLLSNMVFQAAAPVARLSALRTLGSLGALTEPPLLRALNDPDPRVRETALVLAESDRFSAKPSRALLQRLNAMRTDPVLQVRYQLALTLSAFSETGRNETLESLLRRDPGNALVEAAVLGSLQPSAAPTFTRLARDPSFRNSPAGQRFLARLTAMLGVRGDLEEALQTLNALSLLQAPPEQAMNWLYQFGAGLQRTRSSLGLIDAQATNRAVYPTLTVAALDQSIGTVPRVAAIHAVGVSPYTFAEIGDWLLLILNPTEVPAIQSAALETLRRFNDPGVAIGIIERWSLLAPMLRSQAGVVLASHNDWIGHLLNAIQAGRINPADLAPATINFLRTHSDAPISQRAVRLFGTAPVQRPQVLQAFAPALKLDGVLARGRELFAARCAACHNPLQPVSIGGNLASAVAAGKRELLRDIIEPHREIPLGKQTVVLETRAGENLIGIVERESLETIYLRQVDGNEIIIPRNNIASVRPQAWSLMPEGLEMGLNPQGMADLLEYLSTPPIPR